MKIAKIAFGLICLVILASNIVTMLRWSEARGVYDDICYLRQAHLFQRFGAGGIDTDASRDDDRCFEGRKDIAFVPIAMLSLWSVSFASLLEPAEAVREVLLRHRPASVGALLQ